MRSVLPPKVSTLLVQMMPLCCSSTTLIVGFIYCFFILLTFLLYYLFTFINIYSLLRRLAVELATTEVVPSGASRMFNVQYSMFNADDSGRFVVVAEEHTGLGHLAGLDAVELEVGTESIDSSRAAGIVELVACAEVEVFVAANFLWVVVTTEADLAVGTIDDFGVAALDVTAEEGRGEVER